MTRMTGLRRIVAVVAFLTSVLPCIQSARADTSFTGPLPPNGRIAFAHFRDANYSWDIHTVGSSGGSDTSLSEDRARYEVDPVFSPDGTKIAYEFAYDILVMNVDGSDRNVLIGDASSGYEIQLSWSPDGQTLAFLSSRLGENQLFTMPADGSADPTLVSVGVAGVDFYGYSWDPNGSSIVFSAWNSTLQKEQLYRGAADGSGASPIPMNVAYPISPSLSPDGSRMVFVSNVLELANADGSGLTPVQGGVSPSQPLWSPAGDKILFLNGGPDWKWLAVMNADGSNVQSLALALQEARWSPDGSKIVFRGGHDSGEGEIYTISATGGTPKRLTTNTVDDRDPSWGRGCSIQGTAGDDVLSGTAGRDFICGGSGNDTINGLGGDDVVLGGPGDDWIQGGAGNDVVAGETGFDQLFGGGGDDTVNAMDGLRDEPLSGGKGIDGCRYDGRDIPTSCETREQPI